MIQYIFIFVYLCVVGNIIITIKLKKNELLTYYLFRFNATMQIYVICSAFLSIRNSHKKRDNIFEQNE